MMAITTALLMKDRNEMQYWPPLVWLKEVCIQFGKWMQLWLEEHKLVRRIMILGIMVLLWFMGYSVVISNPEKTTEPVAKVVIAYVGLLAVAIGFYQWSRDKDGGNK